MEVMNCPYSIERNEVAGNSCIVQVSWETFHQDVGSIPQNWKCRSKNHQGEQECADRVHQLYSWLKAHEQVLKEVNENRNVQIGSTSFTPG
jgi:hypothetical protein